MHTINIYKYSNIQNTDLRLASVKDYEKAERKMNEFEKDMQEIPPKERLPYFRLQTEEFSRLIAAPSPDVLVAVCPYCERKVWARIKHGVFTLNASFWVMEYDDGKTVTDDSKCGHLYAVDGALNLNDSPVPEKIKAFSFIRNKIYMGAEVPFVKPRILKREGVTAVISSVSIAEKYTGYPVTYFSKEYISQRDFMTGWAREEYCARDEMVSSATFVGERREPQEYDLTDWISQNKIRWIQEKNNEIVLNSNDDIYPYENLKGRRHPYVIQNGQIKDLPNSEDLQTKTSIETFMPGQG